MLKCHWTKQNKMLRNCTLDHLLTSGNTWCTYHVCLRHQDKEQCWWCFVTTHLKETHWMRQWDSIFWHENPLVGSQSSANGSCDFSCLFLNRSWFSSHCCFYCAMFNCHCGIKHASRTAQKRNNGARCPKRSTIHWTAALCCIDSSHRKKFCVWIGLKRSVFHGQQQNFGNEKFLWCERFWAVCASKIKPHDTSPEGSLNCPTLHDNCGLSVKWACCWTTLRGEILGESPIVLTFYQDQSSGGHNGVFAPCKTEVTLDWGVFSHRKVQWQKLTKKWLTVSELARAFLRWVEARRALETMNNIVFFKMNLHPNRENKFPLSPQTRCLLSGTFFELAPCNGSSFVCKVCIGIY